MPPSGRWRAPRPIPGGPVSTTQTDVTPIEAITLTDTAASKVAELIEQEGNPDLALRVAVRPGGCSGFSYEMFFDTDVADDDLTSRSGRSRWSWTRPAPACCRARPWTSRTGCRAPGSASTTPTPAAPAAAGSPSAELTLHVAFALDGRPVEVASEDGSLLDALREDLGVRSVKDGCSPQGQCGCCTVLVDGVARVACVTPLRRVAGRSVTTVDGLDPEVEARLVTAFVRHGASQCGFCTPGILCRLAPLGPAPTAERVEIGAARPPVPLHRLADDRGGRRRSLGPAPAVRPTPRLPPPAAGRRRPSAGPPAGPRTRRRPPSRVAARRATLEGGTPQRTGAAVVLGRGGFAADTAPPGCLVAVPDRDGGWAVGETLAEARAASGQVPGRRSGQPLRYPLEVPPGDWDSDPPDHLGGARLPRARLRRGACPAGSRPTPPAMAGAFGGKLARRPGGGPGPGRAVRAAGAGRLFP